MMKGLLLSVGLFLCVSSGHAHIQTHTPTHDKSHAHMKVQGCDNIEAYDDHLHETSNISKVDIDTQGVIDACQYAVSENPNNPYDIYQLAQAYYNHKDYAQAYDYYRQAAEDGYASAEQSLGKLYRMGRGVAQSDAEAAKWFLKAAKQGDVHAQSDLGGMYYQGRGVVQSHEQALKWTLSAAEQGDSYAQYNVGLIYETGRGVTQSYEKAIEWYQKSADQGNTSAQSKLDYLRR
ncbi:MAG: tetratricopeptide repeat protein [Psychrobacter sp.]|uniref:tetratricopeptide repeat protein n=1 Tax=Psychrobacter sp. AOP7-B1-24 TaxID=3457645 RepID=UPI003FB9E402